MTPKNPLSIKANVYSKLTGLLFLLLVFSSCNPSGTGYYLFKGVWDRDLERETRISAYVDCDALLHPSGDCALEYMNVNGQQAYMTEFLTNFTSNLGGSTNVILVDSLAEYHIEVISLDLYESCEFQTCGNEEFNISSLNVDVTYQLYNAKTSEKLMEDKASVSESESLREKTQEDGSVDCRERLQLMSFSSLIDRISDKMVAKVTNRIRKEEKD